MAIDEVDVDLRQTFAVEEELVLDAQELGGIGKVRQCRLHVRVLGRVDLGEESGGTGFAPGRELVIGLDGVDHSLVDADAGAVRNVGQVGVLDHRHRGPGEDPVCRAGQPLLTRPGNVHDSRHACVDHRVGGLRGGAVEVEHHHILCPESPGCRSPRG